MVVLEILTEQPLLALFLVMALGTLLGRMRFGPVQFGAAGALFVGLIVGALDPRLGESFGVYQTFGLALFVYMIGLSAGNGFFRDMRKQYRLMLAAVGLFAIYAVGVSILGSAAGLGKELTAGTFTGTLTSTPALAAASRATGGSTIPAVGYAIAYPFGVIIPMILVSIMMSSTWVRSKFASRRDPGRPRGSQIRDMSVRVTSTIALMDVPGVREGTVSASYLLRRGMMTIVRTDTVLHEGDEVVLVGFPESLDQALETIGERAEHRLLDDRSAVDYRRILVSNPRLEGRLLRETRIASRYGAIVTRLRRGDEDMVASPWTRLELGDRVRVVAPREQIARITEYLGDSEKRINSVDFLALGLGISVGLLLGLVSIPIGGGASFALGSAAGPLVVGLILGRWEHTGPILWTLPRPVNLTIRQLGLSVFLAAVGVISGPSFADKAFTLDGLKVALVAAASLILMLPLVPVAGALLGVSLERSAGAVAAFVGQSVVLEHALNLGHDDERTASGYAAVYALGIVVQLLLVQFMVT